MRPPHLLLAAEEHGEVLYAVPGSPRVLERTVDLLAEEAAVGRVELNVLPAVSFLDLVWSRLGVDPFEEGVRLVDGHRELLLLKKTYSAFSNPNLEPVLAFLAPSEVIVFGVATDVCNHAAITGLLARGYDVAFVEDASRGLSEERVAAVVAQWRARGVRFTTTDEVVAASP